MSFGLSEKHLNLIKSVLKNNHHIQKAVIFGSRAMGNYQSNSDIDIVLYGDITLKEKANIYWLLDELPTPYKFDVLVYNEINHEGLIEHIKKFGVELTY